MTNYTTKAQQQVEEFHVKFSHPTSDKPKAMDLERAVNRSVWTGEEIIEYLHASCDNEEEFVNAYDKFVAGLRKAWIKSSKVEYNKTEEEKVIAQADALVDAEYFIKGSFVEIGVDSQPVFDIVHSANISKLFTDEEGNKYAKYREDGKILKSPEFFSPEVFIEEEIKKQLNK